MTILITDEFGTRELEGEELESHLAAKDSAEKAISDAEALLQLPVKDKNMNAILIANEFGTRELEGEELESYLAAKTISDAEALLQLAEQMRNYRNEILMRCDWTELPSSSLRLDAEALAAWTTYRQALRDIPSQTEFPLKITWPTQP